MRNSVIAVCLTVFALAVTALGVWGSVMLVTAGVPGGMPVLVAAALIAMIAVVVVLVWDVWWEL